MDEKKITEKYSQSREKYSQSREKYSHDFERLKDAIFKIKEIVEIKEKKEIVLRSSSLCFEIGLILGRLIPKLQKDLRGDSRDELIKELILEFLDSQVARLNEIEALKKSDVDESVYEFIRPAIGGAIDDILVNVSTKTCFFC